MRKLQKLYHCVRMIYDFSVLLFFSLALKWMLLLLIQRARHGKLDLLTMVFIFDFHKMVFYNIFFFIFWMTNIKKNVFLQVVVQASVNCFYKEACTMFAHVRIQYAFSNSVPLFIWHVSISLFQIIPHLQLFWMRFVYIVRGNSENSGRWPIVFSHGERRKVNGRPDVWWTEMGKLKTHWMIFFFDF